LYGFVAGADRIHEKVVRDLKSDHKSELEALKRREKGKRFGLFRRYRKRIEAVERRTCNLNEPRVFIDYSANQPSFLALKSVGGKDYRVFRVQVTNDGGTTLHNLRAQLKLSDQHTSYENEDLTLKEEGLPIIRQILYRHQQDALPRPRTSSV